MILKKIMANIGVGEGATILRPISYMIHAYLHTHDAILVSSCHVTWWRMVLRCLLQYRLCCYTVASGTDNTDSLICGTDPNSTVLVGKDPVVPLVKKNANVWWLAVSHILWHGCHVIVMRSFCKNYVIFISGPSDFLVSVTCWCCEIVKPALKIHRTFWQFWYIYVG